MSQSHAQPPADQSADDVRASQYFGATVCITVLAPFIRLLDEYGQQVARDAVDGLEQHLQRWGISLAEIEGPNARLPHGLVAELITFFSTLVGDPAAAAKAASKLQAGDYELLEYLCASAPTLGASIDCLARYYPLLISAELHIQRRADFAELRFQIAPGLEAPDAFSEFAHVSNYVMSILHLKIDENLLPLHEVTFAHAAPAHAAFFEDFFGCPVRFGCSHNTLVFPTRTLDQPMAHADPVLHQLLVRLADIELQALFDNSAFPSKVRSAMEATMANGSPLEDVARLLKVSPNTLRAQLRKYGLTYGALLDQLRRETAQRALRQSQLQVAEVAQQLGFAHPPAFNRAFKRWFGVAPSAYRLANPTALADKLRRRG